MHIHNLFPFEGDARGVSLVYLVRRMREAFGHRPLSRLVE